MSLRASSTVGSVTGGKVTTIKNALLTGQQKSNTIFRVTVDEEERAPVHVWLNKCSSFGQLFETIVKERNVRAPERVTMISAHFIDKTSQYKIGLRKGDPDDLQCLQGTLRMEMNSLLTLSYIFRVKRSELT